MKRIQYIKVKTKYIKTKRFLHVQHNRMMSMLFWFNSNKPMTNYYQTTKLYTRPCCFGLFQKLQRYRSALNLNIRLTIVGGKLRKIFKRILCPSAFSLPKATLSFPRNMCILWTSLRWKPSLLLTPPKCSSFLSKTVTAVQACFFSLVCEIAFFLNQPSPNQGRKHFTLNILLFSINKHTKTQIYKSTGNKLRHRTQ